MTFCIVESMKSLCSLKRDIFTSLMWCLWSALAWISLVSVAFLPFGISKSLALVISIISLIMVCFSRYRKSKRLFICDINVWVKNYSCIMSWAERFSSSMSSEINRFSSGSKLNPNTWQVQNTKKRWYSTSWICDPLPLIFQSWKKVFASCTVSLWITPARLFVSFHTSVYVIWFSSR